MIGGLAVGAEKERGGGEVGGGEGGEVGGGVGGVVVEEELAGVGTDIGGEGGVKGEGVEGAARESAAEAVMGVQIHGCTGHGGRGRTRRRRSIPSGRRG